MTSHFVVSTDIGSCLAHAIAAHPQAEAIRYGSCSLSFDDLGRAVGRCMRQMQAQVPRDAPVGLLLSRTPEYVIAYLALAALGKLVVPFDDTIPDREIAAEVRQLQVGALVTSRTPDRSGPLDEAPCRIIRIAPCVPESGQIPWTTPADDGDGGDGSDLLASLAAGPDTPLVLLRTSGSTSRPRRVLLTHANALASSRAHRSSVGHGQGETSLVVLPMSFGYCHATQLVAQIDTAGTLALLPGLFTPRTFCAAVAASAATTTTLVPSMLTMLARSGSPFFGDLASLRTIVFGGAPVEQEVLAALRRGLPQVELIQTYGQTEAGPRIATLRGADAAIRPGSVGRPVPGVKVAIRTPAGQDLPAGETGEIVVRGDGVMSGYYGDPAGTAQVLAGGWLRTGDLGLRDEDGFLWLSGRLRNLIITAGRNVAAEEVEQHLREMPEILDAAVFGEPDELRGESIHALVVPRAAPPEPRAVRAFLGSRLEPHKIPRRISTVDALPVAANGKVDRTRLGSLTART